MTTRNTGRRSAGSTACTPGTPAGPRRADLAAGLAGLVDALGPAGVPSGAASGPALQWHRAEPLATMDAVTRQNTGRCRAPGDFGYDPDAAGQPRDEAVRLPGAKDRPAPRRHHGDLTAENLLVRDGRPAAVPDFGALSAGDPAAGPVVAREVPDPPSRETFRRKLGADDTARLRGRAWALSLTFMIWYYWATMPQRRARSTAVGRNVLTDAGQPG